MTTLVLSDPLNGATDVYLNKSIYLTFDDSFIDAPDVATVHQGNIFLIEISTGISVDVTITLPGNLGAFETKHVIVTPKASLKSNTQYRLTVVGSDLGTGDYIIANGDPMITTLYVTFTTGESVYNTDTTIEKDAADKSLEGDLFLPSNLKALDVDFVISLVRPKNHSWDIAQNLTGDNSITFTFSKALATGTSTDTWANVYVYPLLNDTTYLASGTDFGSTYIDIPDYSYRVTGQQFRVEFSGNLPKNTAINIELTSDIAALDHTEYGGNMQYTVCTELYPKIGGVDLIKNEIRPIASKYNDDYIAALLFKNSIWIWEKVGQAFPVSAFPYAAKQYVIYTTILDLLEDVDLAKWVQAGVSRQLGDFAVSVQNLIGSAAIKASKYQKLKDIAFETLNRGWSFKVGSDSLAYLNAASDTSRLWYNVNGRDTDPTYKFYQEDVPATNVTINRWAKTNNPYW